MKIIIQYIFYVRMSYLGVPEVKKNIFEQTGKGMA